MKKRCLSLLLLLATLLGCVPVVSVAADTMPAMQSESPSDYAALYTERGLVSLFTAFEGDDTVNISNGVWQDRVSGATASLRGAWELGPKGGVGYDLAGNELADTTHYLDLGIEKLPSADYTVEYAVRYKDYTSTPTYSGSYYVNQKGDEIGTLKQFSVLAGTLEGVSAPLVRWYMSNLGWNEGDVKGSSNRFAFNDTTRASRALSVYTVTRAESQKSATDGSGKVLHATYSLYYNGTNTAAASGSDAWRGTLNCSEGGKVSGTKHYFKESSEDKFILFKGTPVEVYAVRIYSVALTANEIAQNRGVDILALHGFDLTNLNKLGEPDRKLALQLIGALDMETATVDAVERIIADCAPKDVPKTEYDLLYVQNGLIGLYTAFGNDASLDLSTATVGKWYNKIDNRESAVLNGGNTWWKRGDNGGFGYTMNLTQWQSSAKQVGISLPDRYADLENFTVETVTSLKGITNADGTRYVNVYTAAEGSTPATGSRYGYYSNNFSSFRFDCLYSMYFVTLHQNGVGGSLLGNMSFTSRWMFGQTGYASHNWNKDYEYRPANPTGIFKNAGEEWVLREKSMHLPTLDTAHYVKTASKDGSGQVEGYTYQVSYNGKTAVKASLTVTEFDALFSGAKTNESATAFSLFNAIPSHVYAIRVYDRPLLESEKAQNHFADVAAYYGLDLTEYYKLPHAENTISKNSFIVHKSSADGYHPNQLTGYITALMTYIAITGESAVGQSYSFWNDTSLDGRFSPERFIETYYTEGETNYPAIFASEHDMQELQMLVDTYYAEKAYREYNFITE